MRAVLHLLISFLLAFSARPTMAQWARDGAPVTFAPGSQVSYSATSDGNGGVVVVWVSDTSSPATTWDIYAQRLDTFGVPQWGPTGVVVCNAAEAQSVPSVVNDGGSGVIVAWQDFRTAGVADIYAQRLNSSGVAQWAPNGVVVCNAATAQTTPVLISDPSARAIIAWTDARNGPEDIYAQRLNSAGVPQWAANGLPVIVFAGTQRDPQIVTDGSTGVIVVWEDNAGGTFDIYGQRLNVSGTQLWPGGGVGICFAAGDQLSPDLISDGAGGIVSTWEDDRAGTDDIYAQRLDPTGTRYWPLNGVAVCTAALAQRSPHLVGDGAGGAVIAWADGRGGNDDIYSQRISSLGTEVWTLNGVAVCGQAGTQNTVRIASDTFGGAFLTWTDSRSGAFNVYAQRLDAVGVALWTTNGRLVCGAPGSVVATVTPAGNGWIVAWDDKRSNAGSSGKNDIYAQRIEARYGEWGIPEPVLQTVSDNPADQGGKVVVRWLASDRDLFSDALISHYSIWRSTDAAAAVTSHDAERAIVIDPSIVGPDFAGTAVWMQEQGRAAPAYWEWVSNLDATYLPSYSYTAATRQDSVAGEPAIHYFKILSHARVDPTHIWESADMSGFSVDNLAPAAPLMLTAQRVGVDVHLKWNRVRISDLRDYSVYRADATGVTPVPGNFLSASDDTVLVDASAPLTALYYIVTAYDVHDNQSAPSNEANVAGPTGVGNTPIPKALTLQGNAPNPFNAETMLRIGLPTASDVRVEVYDVAGRRVAVRTHALMSAGWREIAFDGRDDGGRLLASGVYFSRIIAAGETQSQKMVIQR